MQVQIKTITQSSNKRFIAFGFFDRCYEGERELRRERKLPDWLFVIQGLEFLVLIGSEDGERVKGYGGLDGHSIQFTTTSRTIHLQLQQLWISGNLLCFASDCGI